jgi:hypothetical protein
MGGASSTYYGEDEHIRGFDGEDPGLDTRIILKWGLKIRRGDVDCIHMTENKDKWLL